MEYDWLESRKLRSVDQLKLWSENPRLDPEEAHDNLKDYTHDLIAQSGEKDSFLKLITSIATHGFVPADPVVVWQDSLNKKYFVAEGNRRVLALKLLRDPLKAPKSIRNHVLANSRKIDSNSLKKIRVCVAPSFDACEWYINQRHADRTIQQPWSRHQQQRWIAELYDKYSGDINKVMSITGFTQSQLQNTLRILSIRDMALDQIVMNKLSFEDQEALKSHRLPMTILERWFMSPVIKDKWGLSFVEDKVITQSNKRSFLNAYAEWIKLVLHRDDHDVPVRINTRINTGDFEGILEQLPEVTFDEEETSESEEDENTNSRDSDNGENNSSSSQNTNTSPTTVPLKHNPDRPKLVIQDCELSTSNHKLDALFRELKKIPTSQYKNCIAASLRVFLDLSVLEFAQTEPGCRQGMCQTYGTALQDITLKQRLEYLKQNHLTARTPSFKVVEKLLNHTNLYSLDILNSYIHGSDTHHTSKQYLNGFWDFLFPLFEKLIEIKEF